MQRGVEISLERRVQNCRILEVDPEEVRREFPVLIATGFVRLGGQISVLPANGKAVAGNIVRRPVVDDERHDRLEVCIRFVEAGYAIHEWVRGGEGAGDIGAIGVVPGYVVAGDGSPHVEKDAIIIKNTRRPCACPVACAEGFRKPVAARCWVSADPVVGWLLVGLNYDSVALACE